MFIHNGSLIHCHLEKSTSSKFIHITLHWSIFHCPPNFLHFPTQWFRIRHSYVFLQLSSPFKSCQCTWCCLPYKHQCIVHAGGQRSTFKGVTYNKISKTKLLVTELSRCNKFCTSYLIEKYRIVNSSQESPQSSWKSLCAPQWNKIFWSKKVNNNCIFPMSCNLSYSNLQWRPCTHPM